jgi:hypothetical protein
MESRPILCIEGTHVAAAEYHFNQNLECSTKYFPLVTDIFSKGILLISAFKTGKNIHIR